MTKSSSILSLSNVSKHYKNGFTALKHIDLTIHRGEIFALLGPNGAGKTTLINSICGLVNLSGGQITIDGFDHQSQYKQARALVGLVPQEISTESFANVISSVRFSRGLFGLPPNEAYIKKLLVDLRLWDKRHSPQLSLSGGMKRRVLIAKALAHEPKILFLDEPTAGVDVSLRQEMWQQIRELKAAGTTIILTTHYLEEAEELADRIGMIQNGQLLLVEDKTTLMANYGDKTLSLYFTEPLPALPLALQAFGFTPHDHGWQANLSFQHSIDYPALFNLLGALDLPLKHLSTHEHSLEDIFVRLMQENEANNEI